ncbi:fumarylacetoacetate hydrolase family protein [Dactylosporangium sp. NPDC049525]|uniref:fumarylacetoacetate hydrolase family protein n=1 Tax=Dactylosporangium sp. NPDC049525 TaxID=3154730 RepID=UPI003426BE3D
MIVGSRAVDVSQASDRRFGSNAQAVYERWDEFVDWAHEATLPYGVEYDASWLQSPVPAPRQVLAIGLNYREHATEAGFAAPAAEPPVFTKFPSCIAGPYGEIVLPPGGDTDWEVELVVVVGRRAHRVDVDKALSYVAGYAVGQDISERRLQMAAVPPQFSLGKSFPGFGPIGPWLVTLDEFKDPNDLELSCAVDGEQVQLGRTRDLIFSVPELVSRLSAGLVLLPGDVIFTGTPSGVGLGRRPPRFLRPGNELMSRIEGIGELRHRIVAEA